MVALKLNHCLSGLQLYDMVPTPMVPKLLYAALAWLGYAREQDRTQLRSVMSKLICHLYLPDKNPTFEQLCREADNFLCGLKKPGSCLA